MISRLLGRGALVLLGAGSAPVSMHAQALRVLTYNIHAGADAAGAANLERVAALIDSLAPDLVLVQEVDRGTARARGVDQLRELEARTGLRGVFAKTLDYQGGAYGIALLSRRPPQLARVVALAVEPPQERAGGLYEPRAALHVMVATEAGPLHVINTHLDPSAAGTYRKQELIALLAYLQRAVPAADALLLGGDLNVRPGSAEIAALRLVLHDAWERCGTGAGETFPSHAPDRRIDYLFFRRGDCRGALVPGSQASDHRPLLVILELRSS